MGRKVGDLVFIESCDSIWKFNNTSLIYLGYVRGDIASIGDGRAMYFFYGEKNRRIAIREKVLERMKIKNDTKV
ncbi:MAG: hypothetical protein EBY39_09850 [Flavobacteriia bacterium]|nr:hypothetical protein [Flavobacteriia bacterium]